MKIAAPPYESFFMQSFRPLVVHPDISDGLHAGKDTDYVNEFLGRYGLNLFGLLYFGRQFIIYV